tara:strand:+ start:55 stop:270 length:216 start_codon:yes stop_codon:yes gene_type:complete
MRVMKLSMAIASCLSDAQEEIQFKSEYFTKKAIQRLNYAKLIVFEHTNLEEEVTTDYLDTLWMEAGKYNKG